MFLITEDFKAAMDARLKATPVNARHLIVASGITFDEITLPASTRALLSRGLDQFRLVVSNALGEDTQNILYAKALAHMLLHANRFAPNTVWSDDANVSLPTAFSKADIGPKEERDANYMAIEILIPTVALRESFLYTQGNLAQMATTFKVPKAVIQDACVRRNLLHPNAISA